MTLESIDEDTLDRMAEACADARQSTLDSGSSIVESQDGWLVRVYPNGTIDRLEPLPPRTKVDTMTTHNVKKGL